SEIMVAFNGSDAIAAGIFTYQKHRVIYYYGASSNANRELMAPYLLQWRAIQEAKIRGCGTYDFLGIAPEDATKNHPWKGITEFKQKFGGSVLQYPQARDIIHRPFWYQFFQFAKTIQKLIRS
ncbi:MAG: peptidoglycan bridge formation glycyltransferase FemA/FemB family protein, partial [Candidatus Gracilibacteria bacterium]|nr:peptidoglycan bridge formation glycyltransferase FemA/FemB family protein [Candidatus Gracilibacteria bacterium]